MYVHIYIYIYGGSVREFCFDAPLDSRNRKTANTSMRNVT